MTVLLMQRHIGWDPHIYIVDEDAWFADYVPPILCAGNLILSIVTIPYWMCLPPILAAQNHNLDHTFLKNGLS